MIDPGPALALGRLLDRAAATAPDREAIVFEWPSRQSVRRSRGRAITTAAEGDLTAEEEAARHVALEFGSSASQVVLVAAGWLP